MSLKFDEELIRLTVSLAPLLMSNFAHAYKLCREAIGRTLFILLHLAVPPSADNKHPEVASLRAAALHQANLLLLEEKTEELNCLDADGGEDGAVVVSTTLEAAGARRRSRETAVHWLVTCALCGDRARHRHWGWWELLPRIFDGVADGSAEPEHVDLSRGVIRFLAQSVCPADQAALQSCAKIGSALAASPSWRVREEASKFCGVVAARLSFGGESRAEVVNAVVALLGDERSEVAQSAKETIALLLLTSSTQDASELRERFTGIAVLAMKRFRKRQTKVAAARASAAAVPAPAPAPIAAFCKPGEKVAVEETDEAAEKAQRAIKTNHEALRRGALGCAAVVLAHPYEVDNFFTSWS